MRLTVFLGTRPEVIKLAPVIQTARMRGHSVQIVFSGQHEELAEPLLQFFDLRPAHRMTCMINGQSLVQLSARMLTEFDRLENATDWVVVQGDTTTAFIAAYWAFLRNIPVAHVEAGLRTHDLTQPFPEEANRQMISRLSGLHFAPTETAAQLLRREGIPAENIHIVGNTGVDAILYSLARLQRPPEGRYTRGDLVEWIGGRRLILITAHRRENTGDRLTSICDAILRLLDAAPGTCAILPVHPNPDIKMQIERRLASRPAQIRLVDPLPYFEFVDLMRRSALLLTDSGGIQEEAPTLGIPILVLRDVTERHEGVAAGFAKVVGADVDKIVGEGLADLRDGCLGRGGNPYGDGKASEKILLALENNR